MPHLNRDLWRLALPMILSNLSTPLLGMADTAVVGHLEHPYYLGAVALGGTLFSFLYWGFGFLRMGTTGLTAQALGRGDEAEITAALARALILSLVIATALLALQKPISTLAFRLLEASAQAELHGRRYFSIRILSAPATLATYACIGWFIGLQNTRIPLFLILLVNTLNIGLDFVFVWHLKWQVAGVAAASVLAEYTGLMIALMLVARQRRSLSPPGWPKILHWPALRKMFAVNLHLFVRTLLLIFSFAFFTAQSARLGDIVLAANTLLLNLQSFMAYTLDGFAHAAEALVGRALGKRDPRLLRSTITLSGRWTMRFALAFSLTYSLFGEGIIQLLTSLPQVREEAVAYLPWAILLPPLSAWSFLLDGVFIGLTRVREMRNVMILSVIGFYLPSWWALQPAGNAGLWTAFAIFMTARALLMEMYRRRILANLGLETTN